MKFLRNGYLYIMRIINSLYNKSLCSIASVVRGARYVGQGRSKNFIGMLNLRAEVTFLPSPYQRNPATFRS